ncbi:GMC oxidoreductase [Glaciecola sp. KUL10]|uniref:GMC oxidoreductase n=1 Tax=Glaciecola sp. (strain KUL10) TaxID=2161813 RepID=UPI000D783813|nr:GMC family oxidoreductase [Glaciecola sp. KUL10]GBL05970.1 GMC oxidoreductase family protein [Glaciecola sp. KUL10]
MTEYDAIVVGSGISGGWSAKELAEKGLNVLVLERGPKLEHAKDYDDFKAPWQRPNFDWINQDELQKDYPIQSRHAGYAMHESNKHFWVKDSEHPYSTPKDKPYAWVRGYHTGGRSLMWWRQSYRLGPQDFTANLEDGHGVDWPIRYEDLAPWYDYVETFAGIAGTQENIPHLPDSVFQPPFDLTCVEKDFKKKVEQHFKGRKVIPARVAHLTKPTKEQMSLGRGQCQVRNRCAKGCSFGAYFSSLSATLPAAMRTGRCTVVHNAIVHSLDYDELNNRIQGVKVIDANTNEVKRYKARLVFLNASTIATAMILLQSKSKRFPNGLANDSGHVGHNLMDHVSGGHATGDIAGYTNIYYHGRRPSGIYVPRFTNIGNDQREFKRGFGYQGGSHRVGWSGERAGVGEAFKLANQKPGTWRMHLYSFGEVLPDYNNHVSLHKTKKDKWGLPLAHISAKMGKNEELMMQAAQQEAYAMLKSFGAININRGPDAPINVSTPGDRIHEMGTARMGRDPKTSVLNKWSQAHDVPNLFITDGAAMTSGGCQNPSLTYMALSARAADYAVKQFKANKI